MADHEAVQYMGNMNSIGKGIGNHGMVRMGNHRMVREIVKWNGKSWNGMVNGNHGMV